MGARWNIDWEAFFIVVMGLVCLLFIWYGIKLMSLEAKCLENGWRDAKLTWNFREYCIREENEYEIVKPLSEILKGE